MTTQNQTTLDYLTISTHVRARNAIGRFWQDQRGASISTVLLIAILVVAVAAFGTIVATSIGEAGTAVDNVDFTGGGGGNTNGNTGGN